MAERMEEMSQPLVIYHGNCLDGFGAAWVARKYFLSLGVVPEFFAGVYGKNPPSCKNKAVYLLDFTYKRSVLETIIKEADHVTILDHHKTAEEDLKGLTGIFCVFDMNHSGAVLSWLNFFPGVCVPKLLQYIEDRDLWKFELPKTREINASLFSYPYDFGLWDKLMVAPIEKFAHDGEAIERKHFKDIDELLIAGKRYLRFNLDDTTTVTVPALNVPYTLSSDAGNILAKGEPFAVCYWDTKDHRVFSFRSSERGMDVSKICERYGGGGHQHAAGMRVLLSEINQFEIPKTEGIL